MDEPYENFNLELTVDEHGNLKYILDRPRNPEELDTLDSFICKELSRLPPNWKPYWTPRLLPEYHPLPPVIPVKLVLWLIGHNREFEKQILDEMSGGCLDEVEIVEYKFPKISPAGEDELRKKMFEAMHRVLDVYNQFFFKILPYEKRKRVIVLCRVPTMFTYYLLNVRRILQFFVKKREQDKYDHLYPHPFSFIYYLGED